MASKDSSAFGLSLPASLAGYGDSSALVQGEVLRLFDECAPRLRRYVRAFGLSAEATEDVVQEVFLQLFRHLQLGRSRANLRGWVFQVGHNLALKQRAKTTRRQKTESPWDAALFELLIDPGANPEQQLAEERRTRRLARGPQCASGARPAVSLSAGGRTAISRHRKGHEYLSWCSGQVADPCHHASHECRRRLDLCASRNVI